MKSYRKNLEKTPNVYKKILIKKEEE